MKFHHYLPQTPAMKEFVRAIWQEDGYTSHRREIILPSGMIEVIFNLAQYEAIAAEIDGNGQQLPRCFINGFNTGPVNLQLPQKHLFFGVQLHPSAVKYVFGVPCGEFTDRIVDLDLIDGGFSSLWQQLAEAPAFGERVNCIYRWMEKKVTELRPQEKLLSRFLTAPGEPATSVNGLADRLCYSTRHLQRKILEISSMNVEELLLYKKLLHSVSLIHTTGLSLTEIAYVCGFTDQSHFIRSFKPFAGMTPGEYRHNRSDTPGHLFQDVR